MQNGETLDAVDPMIPKMIEVPGIPGRLREQTLEEFLSVLPLDYLAQRQLADLRKLALDGAKATGELLEALKRIRTLESGPAQPATRPFIEVGIPHVPPGMTSDQPQSPPVPWPKGECPYCHDMISTQPGPWASHMKRRHDKVGIARPKHDPTPAQSDPRSAAA